jgi:hypothetical protein
MFDGFAGSAIIALVGWFLTRSRGQKSQGFRSIDKSQLSHSPVATGSNIVQRVDSPDLYIEHAERVYSGEPHQVAPATRSRPNLQYVGPREKQVFISPLPQDGIRDPNTSEEEAESFQALVLKFENVVLTERQIVPGLDVIAKIRFQSLEGPTERRIDYGVWLNSSRNCVDIGIGGTRELVLIHRLGNNQLASLEDRRIENRTLDSELSYFEDGNVDGLGYITVTLIDQNTQSRFDFVFKVWCVGIRFCVAQV